MATEAPPTPSGPAHVAVVSFLAARTVPIGGFWVALAGGVALARAACLRGARQGFGASIAAMLETVAIIGPVRFGVPFTQAVTAPIIGRLAAHGRGFATQAGACALVRLLHNAATTAFFIWIVTGGLDAYAGTYEALGRRVGIDVGAGEALGITVVGLLVWCAFASPVQVLVYRRGLRRWGELEGRAQTAAEKGGEPAAAVRGGRFDPRAVTLAAAIAFALLLSGTSWPLLGAVAAWLAVAWAFARPDPAPVPTGVVLATLIAVSAFVFVLVGGLGLETALRRALRAALLVLVATWLRSAAGAAGLREVARRGLGRLRRLPSMPEAARVLDEIASEGRLVASGRALGRELSGVRRRPLPVIDAVLAWVVRETTAFRSRLPAPPLALRARALDAALILLALAPAAAAAGG
jgi:hypothetical protein